MASSIAIDLVSLSRWSMLGNCERSRVDMGIHKLCQKHLILARIRIAVYDAGRIALRSAMANRTASDALGATRSRARLAGLRKPATTAESRKARRLSQ